MQRLLATRRKHISFAWLLALVALSRAALASQSITPAEAANHIGETATVCGKVASTHCAARSHGHPTFINLDKPYPNSPFTVLIWGSDRSIARLSLRAFGPRNFMKMLSCSFSVSPYSFT
jgi:hypothetical protein